LPASVDREHLLPAQTRLFLDELEMPVASS